MKELKRLDGIDSTEAMLRPTQETDQCMAQCMVVYRDDRYVLGQTAGGPYLEADGKVYSLSCHPGEPCTYIKSNGAPVAVIHNAFDPSVALQAFAKGKTVNSVSGRVYEAKEFCEMLAFAASRFYDTDISYVEGALAVEKLKTMGATDPETAVDIRELGVRKISDRFSRSRKLTERIMYTEDGKVYVRIKNDLRF